MGGVSEIDLVRREVWVVASLEEGGFGVGTGVSVTSCKNRFRTGTRVSQAQRWERLV